ncbi:hypothetical protein BpHYR1_053679 [Brachionus plicatilis]|uniref:Uncharacterized protein n=1 Tax=Brachionus plicatilis TaxID=10195 RepID=A0A3M7Q799_BRAPC|nr:hypothetical protein BpHYR1_053679 [Brachionus plicatilis]
METSIFVQFDAFNLDSFYLIINIDHDFIIFKKYLKFGVLDVQNIQSQKDNLNEQKEFVSQKKIVKVDIFQISMIT